MNINNKVITTILMLQIIVSGCSHHKVEKVDSCEIQSPGLGYTVTVPAGWHEVVKKVDVNKHVLWAFTNANFTKHVETPVFRAWDGPEEANAFFTIMEVNRHRNLGVAVFYDDIIRFLPTVGWIIQETGTTKIGGQRCKWWIQSYGEGALHQQCFMFGNGPYLYVMAFTTSYLGEEKQKLFEQIAHSVTFQEGM